MQHCQTSRKAFPLQVARVQQQSMIIENRSCLDVAHEGNNSAPPDVSVLVLVVGYPPVRGNETVFASYKSSGATAGCGIFCLIYVLSLHEAEQ